MTLALVLGGGGPIGIAWEAGLLLGLRDEGVDLSLADTIIGTSAGSIVGANLAISRNLEAFYHQQSTPFEGEDLQVPDMGGFFGAWTKAKLLNRSLDGVRRSIGKSALAAKVHGLEEWLDGIGRRLPEGEWPSAPALKVVAIDIAEGALTVWDSRSGVPLREAVAASCAVPCVFPVVEIAGRRYMDGGMGSPTNAQLAMGHSQVLVLDPLGRIPGVGSMIREEVDALTRAGSQVSMLAPDDATAKVMGYDLMDAGKCAPVAALGRAHGRRAAGLPLLAALRS